MPELLRMPEIAAGTTEAVLSSWSVAENASVSAHDVVAVVETAKAVVDVEAESDGVLLRLLVQPGAEVETGAPIALVASPGETVTDVDAALAGLGVTAGAPATAPSADPGALEVPEAYQAQPVAPAPAKGVLVFSFATPPRPDGSRAVVTISLMDLAAFEGGKLAAVPLAVFADRMIRGVERRREQWKVRETDSEIGPLKVKRYYWTGMAADTSTARSMAGVVYVGIDGKIGFSLYTQDREEHAREALLAGERMLKTFRLGPAGK